MAVLDILLWPDARLSTLCAPVDQITDDIRKLAADMLDTMYAAPGRGLAGPQIGAMLRLFVMDATWKEGIKSPLVMINPEILSHSDESIEMDEACLSIPGVDAPVTRPTRITIRWTDLTGATYLREMDGAEARIAQHEFDHLNGRVHFDRLDAKARAHLEAAYL
ncbi:peptide deformylase [Celeribacter baekdonensis]|uniref:Peptide deformylase n=1 Tax=Celeribacter baekdonensis TaxID=875171 RepID=A0A2R4M538_9RHOB|nr:peptide deformylase [Celeribacter baekdonensis]AVW92273.1 peptide deformylase [Celeribacter baekdonensis]